MNVTMENPEPETVPIENMDAFVFHLLSWHKQKVAVLRHMVDVPEGTAMECDGTDAVLTGDLLLGFKTGLEIALMELGELPFTVETMSEATVDNAVSDSDKLVDAL